MFYDEQETGLDRAAAIAIIGGLLAITLVFILLAVDVTSARWTYIDGTVTSASTREVRVHDIATGAWTIGENPHALRKGERVKITASRGRIFDIQWALKVERRHQP